MSPEHPDTQHNQRHGSEDHSEVYSLATHTHDISELMGIWNTSKWNATPAKWWP